jgi:hypothetical protein
MATWTYRNIDSAVYQRILQNGRWSRTASHGKVRTGWGKATTELIRRPAKMIAMRDHLITGRKDHLTAGRKDHWTAGRKDPRTAGRKDHRSAGSKYNLIAGRKDHLNTRRKDHLTAGRKYHLIAGQEDHLTVSRKAPQGRQATTASIVGIVGAPVPLIGYCRSEKLCL